MIRTPNKVDKGSEIRIKPSKALNKWLNDAYVLAPQAESSLGSSLESQIISLIVHIFINYHEFNPLSVAANCLLDLIPCLGGEAPHVDFTLVNQSSVQISFEHLMDALAPKFKELTIPLISALECYSSNPDWMYVIWSPAE